MLRSEATASGGPFLGDQAGKCGGEGRPGSQILSGHPCSAEDSRADPATAKHVLGGNQGANALPLPKPHCSMGRGSLSDCLHPAKNTRRKGKCTRDLGNSGHGPQRPALPQAPVGAGRGRGRSGWFLHSLSQRFTVSPASPVLLVCSPRHDEWDGEGGGKRSGGPVQGAPRTLFLYSPPRASYKAPPCSCAPGGWT